MAHSSPGQSPSMRLGVSVRPCRPRASARRLAGSMVTTTVLRPSRAPSSATTAAVVVLPTPPEPQHTMMLRSATRSARASGPPRTGPPTPRGPSDGGGHGGRPASVSISAEHRPGQLVELGRADVGGEQERQAQLGQRQLRLQPGRPARPAARSRSSRKRGGRGQRLGLAGAQGHVGVGGRGRDRGRVGVEPEHLGVDAVDDDRAEADADLVLQRERGLDRLVHRRLLGDRDQHHLAALGGPRAASSTSRAWALIGPTLTRVEQAAGRLQEGDGVAGGGGVEHDQVGRPARARAA